MSYTEKEISKMIKDAVKTAIQLQKEAHDEAMQKLVDEHKAAHSPMHIRKKSHKDFWYILQFNGGDSYHTSRYYAPTVLDDLYYFSFCLFWWEYPNFEFSGVLPGVDHYSIPGGKGFGSTTR